MFVCLCVCVFVCLCVCVVCVRRCSVAKAGHHKDGQVLAHRNALLRWYYGIYPLFGYCCVGCELCYVLLFVHFHLPANDLVWQLCVYGCLPGCVFKQVINVAQLMSACYSLAEDDADNYNKK